MRTLNEVMVLLLATCMVKFAVCRNHQFDLPVPAFSLNITQDENIGVEKRVYRRLGSSKQRREDESIAPLFEGLGTHYSFIWVGTPPQRVSVIMDTGSHHTAFPCTGCKCGKHMDPHFDPQRSSTNTIKTCGGDKKCYFKQSYTEGSSWSAFKVRDKVWVGGPGVSDLRNAEQKSIDFDFGCQESETGLFRTQKVDGIMGLSAAVDTLPFQLHAAGVTKTKMFGLCFRHGGGVVTLGGVDTSLHVPSSSYAPPHQQLNRTSSGGVYFAALTKPKGWYTVKMLDVLMRPQSSTDHGSSSGRSGSSWGGGDGDGGASMRSVGGDVAKYNSGKGTIVDSGTTDTYLPSALKAQFQALFRTYAGREFNNKQAQFSKEQFSKLPVIVFRIVAAGGVGVVDLEVFPSSYMELHKDGPNARTMPNQAGRYTPRIYLSEGTGAVLGANAINEHNVIFDPDNMRVGFARSTCSYEKSHSRHDFASSTNGAHPEPPPAHNKDQQFDTATTGKAQQQKSKQQKQKHVQPPFDTADSGDIDPLFAPLDEHSPQQPTVMKPAIKPVKKPAVKPIVKPVGNKFRPSASSQLDLTGTQKKAVMTVITQAADVFVQARFVPCRPVLAMPCNARCDRVPFSDPMVPDMGIIAHSDSEVEYMQVNSRGEVSVLSAIMVQGQQFWKIPNCGDSQGRKLRNTSSASTTSAAATATTGCLRGSPKMRSLSPLARLGRTARRALFAISGASSSNTAEEEGEADSKVDPIDKLLQEEEAAELLRQQSQHRIRPETCSVYCPTLINTVGIDEDRPLPLRLKGNYDDSWSSCDQASHVRNQLQIRPGKVGVSDPNSVLVLRSGADGRAAGESCYEVKGASHLWHSVHAATPAVEEEDGGTVAAVPGKCMVATVVEQPCTPYFSNCTSPAAVVQESGFSGPSGSSAATTDAAAVGEEVTVTTHLKLTGLAYSALAPHQEADLVAAFSRIFNVPMGSVSIAVAPPTTARFSFSLRSSISVQIYMKLNPVKGGFLPADLLKVINRISGSKVMTSKRAQQATYKLLVNSSLKNYILAILKHPNFNTLLANAVLEADTNTVRSGWLVSSSISVSGVTTLVGYASSSVSKSISSRASSAYRAGVDMVNAETCAVVFSSWSGYFGLGKDDPLTSSMHHYQRGAWMLYALATSLLFLTLIGTAVYLLRRYCVRDKQAVRRHSSSSNISGSHGGGNNNSSDSSGQSASTMGSPASSSPAPTSAVVATGSSSAHSKSSGNSMWDKRRKVLQKFTVKR